MWSTRGISTRTHSFYHIRKADDTTVVIRGKNKEEIKLSAEATMRQKEVNTRLNWHAHIEELSKKTECGKLYDVQN